MEDHPKLKWFGAGIAVVVWLAYQAGAPFLAETARMREEAARLSGEIQKTRAQMLVYSPEWSATMDQKEADAVKRLPDEINSSDILSYLLNKFEESNVGKVVFTAVSQRSPMASDFRFGTGQKAPRARAARYRFKALMAQDRLSPFLHHFEGFEGAVRAVALNVEVSGSMADAVEAEVALDFFLSPKEWLPADVPETRDEEEGLPEGQRRWKSIFVSSLKGRHLSMSLGPRKLPTAISIVGDSLVADEQIYDEGDSVNGWTVLKIDPRGRTVTFRRGKEVREVKAK